MSCPLCALCMACERETVSTIPKDAVHGASGIVKKHFPCSITLLSGDRDTKAFRFLSRTSRGRIPTSARRIKERR